MNATHCRAALLFPACVAALFGNPCATNGAEIHWHTIGPGAPPPTLLLTPAEPTSTNLISFVAPSDGQIFGNSCFAAMLDGEPAIAIDPTNQTVNVSFNPVRIEVCPLYVLLVSGVEGKFGPLKPGTWMFNILQSSYASP